MEVEPRWPRTIGRTTPQHWGDGSYIWTGLNVLTGITRAINDLADGRGPWRLPGTLDRPVVLACSPWLTDTDVVNALMRTDCCVVIAKESNVAWGEAARLQADGSRVWKLMLRRLDYYATPGQHDTPVEAYGHDDPNPAHDVMLEPVRVTGWRRVGKEGARFPPSSPKRPYSATTRFGRTTPTATAPTRRPTSPRRGVDRQRELHATSLQRGS